MVIVKILGGMGNQMFQYAFYLAQKKNKNAKLDIFELEDYLKGLDRDSIFNIFNLPYEVASYKEIRQLGCISLFDRLRYRYNFFSKKSYFKERKPGCFDLNVFDKDDLYFDGYWQSYKYFESSRDRLLELFSFPNLDDENLYYKQLIESACNSVSIHIRLGDYLNQDCSLLYGNICTEKYYSSAIDYIIDKYKNVSFFLFSNDTKKASELLYNMGLKNFTVIDCNSEKIGWADMYLMSICKNNIIANSSFSWWSAWPFCVKLVCDISSIFVSYFTFLNVTAFFSFFSKRGCGGKSFFFFLNHF